MAGLLQRISWGRYVVVASLKALFKYLDGATEESGDQSHL
jgi:hypothetical protein